MTPPEPQQHERLGAFPGQERVSPAKMTRVPTRGTPQRTVRVSDDMWVPFAEACKEQGLTPSEVIRDCIRAYLDNHEGDSGGQDHAADDKEH